MAWKETYRTRAGERRYRIAWREGDGSKRSKSFTRSKDADTFKGDVERREQLGGLFEEARQTFGEFTGLKWDCVQGVVVDDGVPSTWVKRYEPSVRPGSFKRRKETFAYLAEFLPLTFDRITPVLVEDIVMQVAIDHPRQAQYLLQTIKMVLRSAALRGQFVREATLRVSPPMYESPRKRFLTMEQLDRLARQSEHPRLIRFAALTGLRFIELAGLTDADVALGDKAVLIHRAITKTDAGVRRVPLGMEAQGILKSQRLERPSGSNHLFPAPLGGRMQYSNFYKRVWLPTRQGFERALAADIPALDFHDLRHTYASLMIAANIHPNVLKDLMGHESIKVTMDTYGHLYTGASDTAVEMLDVFLNRSVGQPDDATSAGV